VKLLETSEILNLVEYERVRDVRRRRIVELKKARRVAVGRYLTFVFENRDTVWFQIQEMVRAEHFVRFALSPEVRASFATSEVALVVEHPHERARTVLADETKRSLLGDLA
jgi:Protein of unknown function (DUF3501)